MRLNCKELNVLTELYLRASDTQLRFIMSSAFAELRRRQREEMMK